MRTLITTALLLSILTSGQMVSIATQTSRPNFVVILCDDLGYGDLGSFGHPSIRTPNLDRLASEGQKWTNFYSAAPVCTPSRAGLLTGRLPVRSGMASNTNGVLFPDSQGGLPANEITIAELLKSRGYATAAIGKWHLGHLSRYLPANHGFDSYFGVPYSNDMDWTMPSANREERYAKTRSPKIDYWNVPLMRDDKIIERPADQNTLTQRYTGEAVKFIQANRNKPFFLYLAHTMPHVPLFRSKEFERKSLAGLYGDVVEELDWSVGRVIDTLRQLKLTRNTLVVFTSDNGPWHIFGEQGGSAGLLRGAKGGTFEGGMRVPTIFWSPGMIKTGTVNNMGSILDLLPTLCKLAGVEIPRDRPIDGHDLLPLIRGTGGGPRKEMFYYRGTKLYAVRSGPFKAHFYTKSEYGQDPEVTQDPPMLFNLDVDPSEKYDIAKEHPEIIADMKRLAQHHQATLQPVENQLDTRVQRR
jgi:arylsulfatase A-like enzyme